MPSNGAPGEDARAGRASITSAAAIMTADPALAVPVEPPDMPPGGRAESPSSGVTRAGGMSSDSAPTRESTVSRPVPGSAPLVATSAVPPRRGVTLAAPGQRAAGNMPRAQPMPTGQPPSAAPGGVRPHQYEP